jgi:HK97 family phage portal protein
MNMRRRLAQMIAPPPSPVRGSLVQRRVYAIGPGGIESLTLRSGSWNQITDAFHGITTVGDLTITNDAAGYAKAYKASVWAYKCVRTRARTLSAIPIVVTNAAGDAVQHPLSAMLSRRNNRLLYATESDMQIFGEAFWRFGIKGGSAWVRRLNPQTIETVADAGGIQGYVQRIDGIKVAEWEPREIAHFFDYDPDNDFGSVAPMALALQAVGVMLNIGTFAEYYFKNGAIPSGILVSETRMQDADKERVLAEWRRKFQGVENSNGTALLDGGSITYQTITPPLKDLTMVELREEERRDICAAFDVPLSIAQAADPALYAAKQDYASFHTLAILPELDLLLDTVNTQVLPYYGYPGVTVEADLNEVAALQEDRGEITTRNAAAVSAGYLSLNTALDREGEEPLQTDYLIIAGKLVPKQLLDEGDFETLRELGVLGVPAAPAPSAFPFMSLPPVTPTPQKALTEPRIIDQPPTRAQVEIVVRADNETEGHAIRDAVLADTLLRDLDRWQRKVAKRGPDVEFNPDYLPSALADWLRSDLRAWDGETPRAEWIDAAFRRAADAVRAEDTNLATPEEFEAYWRGIGDLFNEVASTYESLWQDFPAQLAQALRESGQAGADFDMAVFLTAQESRMIDALAGEDGPLTHILLAGAARGNDLLQQTKAAKADGGLSIDWSLIDAYSRDWAKTYAAEQIRGINATSLDAFRTKIAEWIEKGGTLEDLAKYIEGDLAGLDIPAGWSPGKIEWATSRERARLIAQTETTTAFHEGAVTRWEQADVPQKRFRTQNDVHVDDEICRKLNNAVTGLREMWTHPDGKQYGIPAHPGCRCFVAPAGI